MLKSRKVCVLKPPISAASVTEATACSAGRAEPDDSALAMPCENNTDGRFRKKVRETSAGVAEFLTCCCPACSISAS
jgi:hypothetical protein